MKLKDYHHVSYVSLIADMHNVPLAENSMDIIYMVDALHHFDDMYAVFNKSHRILKKGGKFFSVNEPFRPEHESNEINFVKKYCMEEVFHGINERRPTMREYLDAGSIIHLKVLNEEIDFSDTPGLILRGVKD